MSTNRNPKSKWAKHLARRIAEVQRCSTLTQEAFAAECDVSKATLSRWVNGTAVPRGDSLAAIAERFGVSLDWLLDGIGPDGKPCADPVYRGQYRTRPELEQDVRFAVGNVLGPMLSRSNLPGWRTFATFVDVDGSRVLRLAAEREFERFRAASAERERFASSTRDVLLRSGSWADYLGVPPDAADWTRRVEALAGMIAALTEDSSVLRGVGAADSCLVRIGDPSPGE